MAIVNEILEARKLFIEVYAKYLLAHTNFDELDSVVRNIEILQKKLDIESGFSSAQLLIHDLYIKIPTQDEQIGSIQNLKLENITSNINSLIRTINPTAEFRLQYKLVGIAPGSTATLYDIYDKNSDSRIDTTEIIETKELLDSVFEKAAPFLSIGNTEQKLSDFTDSTGLDKQTAYEVAKIMTNLLPSSDDETSVIEIGTKNRDRMSMLTITKDDKAKLAKSKSDIYQQVKPEERTEITGKLGIMEEWDINHKISIIDSDRDLFTINYDPTQENINRIKDNIGKSVSVRRMRDPDDKRKWILEEWL